MAASPLRSVSLILSPYHLGIRNLGVGGGPAFLRLRLLPALQSLKLPIRELEIPPVDDFEGDIGRSFEVLRRTSALVTQERNAGSFPIVLAGNCTSSVGVAAGLHQSAAFKDAKEDLGCIWFDAHDDYHTPDTVMSGYFDAMPVAMLQGLCWKGILGTVPGHRTLETERIAYVGLRDVSELEKSRVVDAGFDVVWGDVEKRVDFKGELTDMLERKQLGPSLVHLDLDVLDKSLGKANKFAAPGGLMEDDLASCLQAVTEKTQPASLTVASFDPTFEGGEKIGHIGVQAIKAFVDSLMRKGVLASPGA